jgi:hypothetical protein
LAKGMAVASTDREREEIEKFVNDKIASGEVPPWETTDKRVRPWMSARLHAWMWAWVVLQLDRRETAQRGEVDSLAEFRLNVASDALQRGHVELAREFVSKLFSEKYGAEFASQSAELVNPPRRRKRRSKHPFPAVADRDDFMLRLACGYVYKIQDLWVDTYKKKHRPDEPTALSLAAWICGVDEDRLMNQLKKTRRPGPMKKVPARRTQRR